MEKVLVQAWVPRELKRQFIRAHPYHGALSDVVEASMWKAIEEKKLWDEQQAAIRAKATQASAAKKGKNHDKVRGIRPKSKPRT